MKPLRTHAKCHPFKGHFWKTPSLLASTCSNPTSLQGRNSNGKIAAASNVLRTITCITNTYEQNSPPMHTGLTFKNLEFWSSNSRISSSIFLILASAVTFSSCNFCLAPSSSSSCSSRSWEERQVHVCIFQVTYVSTFYSFAGWKTYFEEPVALNKTKKKILLFYWYCKWI